MLATSWACAEGSVPTSDEVHKAAVIYAECGGYTQALAFQAEKLNKPAMAESLAGVSRGWAVASWYTLSAAHDPKSTKPVGAWKDMADSYAYSAKLKMAAELELVYTNREARIFVDEKLEMCKEVEPIKNGLLNMIEKKFYIDKAMKE